MNDERDHNLHLFLSSHRYLNDVVTIAQVLANWKTREEQIDEHNGGMLASVPSDDPRLFKAAKEPAVSVPEPLPRGWFCPNCKRAHAPEVHTCPVKPVDNRTLRDRIKGISNG